MPLISKPVIGTSAATGKQSHALHVKEEGGNAEREWDGPLWKMCGDCDQAGLSTFAYVKMCTPLAFGHNLQRAFGKGFWIHAVILSLLFFTWGYAFMGTSSRVNEACGIHHPPHHLPEPMPRPIEPQQPGLHTDPEEQQFLAGATFNPQFLEEKQDPESTDIWVTVEGSDLVESAEDEQAPTKAPEDERVSLDQDVLQQLQNAKLQAAEGVANLLGSKSGRKMLHKHDHDDDKDDDDDDDDHHHEHKQKGEHKHKHDDKADEHHKDKKHPKKQDKSKNEESKEWKTPEDKMDGPPHGPETPECHDATVSLGALAVAMIFSAIVGVSYAAKLRTAIRKQHGIKGTNCQDCLAWTFCAPCALCQETRTLAKNNVYNGTWYGETVLMEAGEQPLDAPKPLEAPTKPV